MIYVGNNVRLDVIGIGTCKVDLCGGRSLMLHDVLYNLEIRRNLFSASVSVLLDVGCDLYFCCYSVRITLDNVLHCFVLRYDCFIVLDCNASAYDYYVGCCVISYYSSNDDVDYVMLY